MFLTESFDIRTPRPASSGISPGDWATLARFWYPVAVEGDLGEGPMAGKLLDVDLVIYRVEGAVAVARDLCPHRHIRLSAGTIEGDRLVCPFHGMAFNAAGQCTRVPALGREAKLPPSYRLRSFRAEVRYGLVWACLDDASTETVPYLDGAAIADAENRLVFAAPHDWAVSSPRQIENFFDLAHLPFVHANSMGGDPDAPTPAMRVEHSPTGLSFVDPKRPRRIPGKDEMALVDSTYTVTLPFIVELKAENDENWGLSMYDLPAPISAHACRVFMMFAIPVPAPTRKSQPHMGDGAQVTAEDIEILSHLGQPDLPLDARSEIHLPCDKVTVEYRKRLRELGLGQANAAPSVRDAA